VRERTPWERKTKEKELNNEREKQFPFDLAK